MLPGKVIPCFPVLKAVVNTGGGLLASRRVFAGYRWFVLFLLDKFRLKRLLKHANKKKISRGLLQCASNL